MLANKFSLIILLSSIFFSTAALSNDFATAWSNVISPPVIDSSASNSHPYALTINRYGIMGLGSSKYTLEVSGSKMEFASNPKGRETYTDGFTVSEDKWLFDFNNMSVAKTTKSPFSSEYLTVNCDITSTNLQQDETGADVVYVAYDCGEIWNGDKLSEEWWLGGQMKIRAHVTRVNPEGTKIDWTFLDTK